MRVALFIICLLLAGCPRQSNETVPMVKAAARPANPPAAIATSPSIPATKVPVTSPAMQKLAPELKPPIAYLELGSGMTPAKLADSVVAAHPGATTSKDSSALQVKQGTETVWFRAFTTPANDEEIGTYYSGLLGAKGFVEQGAGDDSGKAQVRVPRFKRTWRSEDNRYEVSIYSGEPPVENSATPGGIYVIEVHDTKGSGAGGTGQ